MVRVVFRVDVGLRSELASAREVVGLLKHVGLDADDRLRLKRVGLAQFEHAIDGRFRRDGAVVAL